MKKTIAVASGKGGTGKTTIAVALAQALYESGEKVTLLDSDVEAPNAHLFFDLEPKPQTVAEAMIPTVDEEACTGCGVCREVCEFNAIAMLSERPLVFTELCHSCGACALLCPEKAIREIPKTVGWVETAPSVDPVFFGGRLKIGEARSIPVIEALRKEESKTDWTIIDAPPGTSCPVIAASHHTNYLVLVTEPTPFGLNDLVLAIDMAKAIGLDCGVIINRSDMGDDRVRKHCEKEGVPILLEIPFDRAFAHAYSRGGKLLDVRPEMAAKMLRIANDIGKEVAA